MDSRVSYLFFILLFLTCTAGAVLVADPWRQSGRKAQAESFQKLVGGVGFGPAVDLSGCAFSFDPRLDGTCSADYGPIPGGACFCPRHAGSLFYYPPLGRTSPVGFRTADFAKGVGHGPLP